MRKCQVKKGFFVLKDCGSLSVGHCKICRKEVCENHSKHLIEDDRLLCIECFVKHVQQEKPVIQDEIARWQTGESRNYGLWYYYMRDDFYSKENYEPFTDFDANAFNEGSDFGGGEFGGGGASGFWDDESGKAGFYDS